jgi:hypothetical protein
MREQRRVFALDGKTVRGARIRDTDGVAAAPHLVSVIDQASGAVLGQVQVEARGSEIGVFTTLLDRLDLREMLISADALHAHRGHAHYLHEGGGHYLMTVKATSPRCCAGCARCPGRRSTLPPGNGPAATAGPSPARSAS